MVCLAEEACALGAGFLVQATMQLHELLHVPLAFANAFTNSSLTAAFCPWATDGVRAVAAVSKSLGEAASGPTSREDETSGATLTPIERSSSPSSACAARH